MTNIGVHKNNSCCHHDYDLQDPLLWCDLSLYDRSCVAKVAAIVIIVLVFLVFIGVAFFVVVSVSLFLVFLVIVIDQDLHLTRQAIILLGQGGNRAGKETGGQRKAEAEGKRREAMEGREGRPLTRFSLTS